MVNTSRVLPARLRLVKATGGAAEVLLLEPGRGGGTPELAGPGAARAGAWPPGTVLPPRPPGTAAVEVGERLADGRRRVRLLADPGPSRWPPAGRVALPPYIHEPVADPERYQTVYADQPGSVAAPTAGLHLTDEVLDRCRSGARRSHGRRPGRRSGHLPAARRRPRVEDHVMHTERYRVPAADHGRLPAGRAGGRGRDHDGAGPGDGGGDR